MRKFKLTVAVLAVAFTLIGLGTLLPVNTRPMPVSAAEEQCTPNGAKCLDQCTGTETAGHCADKCPNQTDTLLGYDPTTGAAICKSVPTGCPYGDSIPLDSPKCAPPADPATAYAPYDPTATTAPTNSCWGK